MAFLAKLGLIFSLAVSSFLGLFNHGQVPTSTAATSTVQESAQNITPKITTLTLSNGWTTPFGKDSQHVYFFASTNSLEDSQVVITEADLNTFFVVGSVGGDVISGYYAKDKNYVYYTDNSAHSLSVIQGADPATFTLLPPTEGNQGISVQIASCGSNCQFDAQDKNHKYLGGQIVQ